MTATKRKKLKKTMNIVRCRPVLPSCKFPKHGCAYSKSLNNLNDFRRIYGGSTKPGGLPHQRNGISQARHVFVEMSDWDTVSATSLIGQFARENNHKAALYLFSRMLESSFRPNEYTFGTVIHSATILKDLCMGKQLHCCAAKTGLASNVFVGSAVLDLYVKLSTIEEASKAFEDTQQPNVVSYTTMICGYLSRERFDDARRLFAMIPNRNVVSWNAMISGFAQSGHNEEALNLFVDMLREGLVPTQSTFPCTINAAANLAALGMGKSFHACAVKFLGTYGVFVGNALVSFYAKCGSVEDSHLVFNKLPERNLVSWNALICGFAQNGRGKEAIELFKHMQCNGHRPNSVTLLGVLWACNHAGLVDEGYYYFSRATTEDPGVLKAEHYACMVDLLARSGRFYEAENFIYNLPFDPGIGFWKALLGGCQIHLNMELGDYAAKKILALDPGDVSSYVMMSNAHSAAGRWQSVSLTRQEMREKEMKRAPGCSWIEIQNKIHVFVTRDVKHNLSDEIYMVLGFFIEHSTENQLFSALTAL